MFTCRDEATFAHISDLFVQEFISNETDIPIADAADNIFKQYIAKVYSLLLFTLCNFVYDYFQLLINKLVRSYYQISVNFIRLLFYFRVLDYEIGFLGQLLD